jgi:hypothetical protein
MSADDPARRSPPETAISLGERAIFHNDADENHELALWGPHRHEVNPCSAAARCDACKLPELQPSESTGSSAAFAAAATPFAQLQACWGLFAPASTDEGDWLGSGSIGERDRTGQSVRQYATTKLPKLRLAPTRATIYLVPVGDVSQAPPFDLLCQCVEVVLGLKVKQGAPVILPQELSQIDIFSPGSG